MFLLTVAAAAIVLRPQIARAADIVRYEGVSGIYSKVQEYNYPWTTPNVSWESASPESTGVDSLMLDEIRNNLSAKNTKAFLVIKDGKLIYEWYDSSSGPNNKFSTAAMAKGATASIALAVAADEGLINLDDPAYKYIPEWENNPVKSRITLRQLGSHSSGLDDVAFPPAESDPEWKHTYYENRDLRFRLALSGTPLIAEPDTRYSYSGVGYYVLAYALTSSLQSSLDSDIHTLIEKRIMEPMDIPSSAWDIGYGESYNVDGMKMYAFGSGVKQTARSIARIGELVLNEGEWNGQQIVEPETIKAITSYEQSNPGRDENSTLPPMGIGWHLNTGGFIPSLPEDAIIGMGNGPQVTLVIPTMNMVMVRIGGTLDEETQTTVQSWLNVDESIFRPLIASVNTSQDTDAFAANSP